jgi:hypothetical protein
MEALLIRGRKDRLDVAWHGPLLFCALVAHLLSLLDKSRQSDSERLRDPSRGVERWVANPAFDHADVSRMKPGTLSKFLLGQTSGHPAAADS